MLYHDVTASIIASFVWILDTSSIPTPCSSTTSIIRKHCAADSSFAKPWDTGVHGGILETAIPFMTTRFSLHSPTSSPYPLSPTVHGLRRRHGCTHRHSYFICLQNHSKSVVLRFQHQYPSECARNVPLFSLSYLPFRNKNSRLQAHSILA